MPSNWVRWWGEKVGPDEDIKVHGYPILWAGWWDLEKDQATVMLTCRELGIQSRINVTDEGMGIEGIKERIQIELILSLGAAYQFLIIAGSGSQ